MPVARKSPSGPAAILADLSRTVAVASIASDSSASFSFALNAVMSERGATAGDGVLVGPRAAFAGTTFFVKEARVSALNTITVTVATGNSVAAQTISIDTYVFVQGET